MIDIAMLSCNRKRITELCIRELQARTSTPHRLIVVDNGSEDGTVEMLEGLWEESLMDKLVLLEENKGVHFGFNTLLDLVESEPYYICTDADLIPSVPVDGKDWLKRLIDLAEANPEYSAIACRPHILIGEPPDRFDNCGEIREMSHIGAHLRIMNVEQVRAVGGWDRNNLKPSRNNEDWWIGKRIQEAGKKVGYSSQIRCIHLWGQGPEVENRTEDDWGYPLGSKHGHIDRWPPVSHYSWERYGIDWSTCEPKTQS